MNAEKIRVLLVEDQEIARLGLKLVLERHGGISIAGESENGLSSVAMALEMVPDLVLMDIGLPGIDGIEATRQIKAANPDIKVMMMTSHDHVDDVLAALSAGADGYVLKETSVDLIAAAVKILIMGGVFLDSRIAALLVAMLKTPSPETRADSGATQKPEQPFGLSAREFEILELVVHGFSNPEMAEKLFISNETVKTHMRHIMEKLMVADRTQAAIKALRAGLFVSVPRVKSDANS